SSRRRHTRFSRDWSSDVCSSDLVQHLEGGYQKYLQVHQRTLLGDVFHVQLDPLVEAHIAAPGHLPQPCDTGIDAQATQVVVMVRSEERRVGKEWSRRRWA